MPSNMDNRVLRHQGSAHGAQGFVLHIFKAVAFQSFEFNAYRVVVAVIAPPVTRLPGMPGACITADKLPEFACAADKKMRRYLRAANALKIGVSVPIQLVGEQALNVVVAVPAGRQADGVNHDQVSLRVLRPWPKIW